MLIFIPINRRQTNSFIYRERKKGEKGVPAKNVGKERVGGVVVGILRDGLEREGKARVDCKVSA